MNGPAYFKEHWDLDFTHGLCPECCEAECSKLEKGIAALRDGERRSR